MIETQHVPPEFYSILREEGISLQSEGVIDIALPPTAAQRAVAVLRSSWIGIVGGEVWKKNGDRFILTYDIWNIEKSDYSNHDEYVIASLDVAEQQIKKYIDSKEEVFFALGI